MSILINGLGIPNAHQVRPFYLKGNGDGTATVYEYTTGMQTGVAVHLPAGHGRLGDLDALQEEFKKSHDGKRLMLIDTAPTIIEADLEWKMKNCCCFSNTDQAEGDTE